VTARQRRQPRPEPRARRVVSELGLSAAASRRRLGDLSRQLEALSIPQ
jgi:hypothetical protein